MYHRQIKAVSAAACVIKGLIRKCIIRHHAVSSVAKDRVNAVRSTVFCRMLSSHSSGGVFVRMLTSATVSNGQTHDTGRETVSSLHVYRPIYRCETWLYVIYQLITSRRDGQVAMATREVPERQV